MDFTFNSKDQGVSLIPLVFGPGFPLILLPRPWRGAGYPLQSLTRLIGVFKTQFTINLSSIKKQFIFYSTEISDLTIKSLKIKEAVGIRDEKLFDPDGYRGSSFSSVAGDSVAFSQDFIVSLDFFGSFLCQDKNEQAKNQYITEICYVELRLK